MKMATLAVFLKFIGLFHSFLGLTVILLRVWLKTGVSSWTWRRGRRRRRRRRRTTGYSERTGSKFYSFQFSQIKHFFYPQKKNHQILPKTRIFNRNLCKMFFRLTSSKKFEKLCLNLGLRFFNSGFQNHLMSFYCKIK